MLYFSPTGPLAQRLGSQYRPRPEQVRLAEAVAKIQRGEVLIVNGPVGTGKSEALIVGALESGKRTVICTYSRALIKQLERDAALIKQAYPDKSIEVIHGRNQYVCQAEVEKQRKVRLPLAEWGDTHKTIRDPGAPDEAWRLATNSCPGRRKCDYANDCNYYNQRDVCGEADIVICSQKMVEVESRYQTDAGYWFGKELLIVDEGDRLPDALSEDHKIGSRGMSALYETTEGRLRATLEHLVHLIRGRCRAPYYSDVIPRSELKFIANVTEDLHSELARVSTAESDEDESDYASALRKLLYLARSVTNERVTHGYGCAVKQSIRDDWSSCEIRWEPILVGSQVQELISIYGSTVLVSGSMWLPDGEGFGFAERSLGVSATSTMKLDTPFDYRKNLDVVIASANLPLALRQRKLSREQQTEKRRLELQHFADVAERCHRVANTLILSTSRGGVQLVTRHFESKGIGDELLSQIGEENDELVSSLAQQLLDGGRYSLVGTTSAWIGLDVPSPYKSIVVIEKPPFPSPSTDLRYGGRLDRDREEGKHTAADWYGVPTALRLAIQGIGRSLRKESDRCLVVLCSDGFSGQYRKAIPDGVAISFNLEQALLRVSDPA